MLVIGTDTSEYNELKASIMINEIEEVLGIQFNLMDNFHKWRIKRNEVVHKNMGVDSNKAQEAIEFYEHVKEMLMNVFYTFK
ncbi:MAG: hypothetical protein GF317_17680 [Candidatus Lokiarchaeota archaeon]|nr:hypothetical protein [Candidatus Lokiarchaeota archaeon]MBD3201345.1 hypothetical protein [Candidatus Lokiarchaeota archaeon]